jgi:D-alanyl-lipoteichoic acid acyltransferase DltB (MBOAT superfamily)
VVFSTYDFLFFFLPICLAVSLSLRHLGFFRSYIASIVLFSFLFYAFWNPNYLWILGNSIFFNYLVGVYAYRTRKFPVLILGVSANLLLIGYYKYKLFFGGIANDLLGTSFTLGHVILPLGISFFTFQQIAWLVDCWQGKAKERDFLSYSLFISFFPQLIAGPIVHHAEIMPQVTRSLVKSNIRSDLTIGLSIFIAGLAKKVLIADRLAPFADYMFASAVDGQPVGMLGAWSGVSAYALQIYFDFSAYSDMAIGLARMFGIDLPLNFNSPYKAHNIQDFWRRWHMTLSRFLRDYLYFPLGGNRHGQLMRWRNLMITMLLGGLWHGANWTFVFWGGLHGLYLVAFRFWLWTKQRLGVDIEFPTFVGVGITLFFVVLAWVPFRAESFAASLDIYAQMFGIAGATSSDWMSEGVIYGVPETIARGVFAGVGANAFMSGALVQLGLISLALMIALTLPNTAEIFSRYFSPADGSVAGNAWSALRVRWSPSMIWLVYIAGIFVICVIFMRRQAPFLYFQF